jgi:SAM-dependent methyltransferase
VTTTHNHEHEHDHEHEREHEHGHGHAASHEHGAFDWAVQLKRLELGAELHRPFFEQAAAWLRELRGGARTQRVLDVGSGAGVVSTLLAEVFPEAEVVAVDATPALLEAVKRRARRLGVGDRMQVVQADLPREAAKLPEADLIWTSDAVHHFGDQQAAVDLLHGRLRQGGVLAVCEGGLPARFLPNEIGFGRSGLQTRLDAAGAEGFAAMRASLPDARAAVDDWSGMLRTSGFDAVATRTFLLDVPAPLATEGRDYLVTNLAAHREWISDHLDASDHAAIARLLDADDPEGLMRRPDVFFLTARTVYTGINGSVST